MLLVHTSGERSEPVTADAASTPGQIAYKPSFPPPATWSLDYTITGYGDNNIIITLRDDWEAKEAIVEQNCLLVQTRRMPII